MKRYHLPVLVGSARPPLPCIECLNRNPSGFSDIASPTSKERYLREADMEVPFLLVEMLS